MGLVLPFISVVDALCVKYVADHTLKQTINIKFN